MARVIVLPGGWSDGNVAHRPTGPRFSLGTPDIYLEKLGAKYMQEKGRAVPGKSNVLCLGYL